MSLAFVVASLFAAGEASAEVSVSGHMRHNHNGSYSYVQRHYRTHADTSFYNNWSTYPNINPYTGAIGTHHRPSYGYKPPLSQQLHRQHRDGYAPSAELRQLLWRFGYAHQWPIGLELVRLVVADTVTANYGGVLALRGGEGFADHVQVPRTLRLAGIRDTLFTFGTIVAGTGR